MKIKQNLYFAPIALSALLTLAQPLQAQTCRSDIMPTTPTQDFTLHDDGTATHHKTGLTWMRCAIGQNWDGAGCADSAQWGNWQGALQFVDSFSFAGHSDWRLPDIKELNSIVELACADPAINAAVFPSTPGILFWSASPYAGDLRYAWLVDFRFGDERTYIKASLTSSHRVRLVRGGQ